MHATCGHRKTNLLHTYSLCVFLCTLCEINALLLSSNLSWGTWMLDRDELERESALLQGRFERFFAAGTATSRQISLALVRSNPHHSCCFLFLPARAPRKKPPYWARACMEVALAFALQRWGRHQLIPLFFLDIYSVNFAPSVGEDRRPVFGRKIPSV
jgi:hypothetical protein